MTNTTRSTGGPVEAGCGRRAVEGRLWKAGCEGELWKAGCEGELWKAGAAAGAGSPSAVATGTNGPLAVKARWL